MDIQAWFFFLTGGGGNGDIRTNQIRIESKVVKCLLQITEVKDWPGQKWV